MHLMRLALADSPIFHLQSCPMELTGSQILPVSQSVAWDALNDPIILKASIAGCEELTQTSDSEFVAAVTAAIGPVKAKFKAKLTLLDVNAPNSYRIRFDGQGGVAGFGKGEAKVDLVTESGQTRLDYAAQATVGGKLAQIGSRLVDAAAKKMAEDFFSKFKAELASRVAPAETPPAAPSVEAPTMPPKVQEVPANSSRTSITVTVVLAVIVAIVAVVVLRS